MRYITAMPRFVICLITLLFLKTTAYAKVVPLNCHEFSLLSKNQIPTKTYSIPLEASWSVYDFKKKGFKLSLALDQATKSLQNFSKSVSSLNTPESLDGLNIQNLESCKPKPLRLEPINLKKSYFIKTNKDTAEALTTQLGADGFRVVNLEFKIQKTKNLKSASHTQLKIKILRLVTYAGNSKLTTKGK